MCLFFCEGGVYFHQSIFNLTISLRFLPETLRAVVGDGSIRPAPIHRPIIPVVGRNRITQSSSEPVSRKKAFRNPFILLKNVDIVVILLFNGLVVAVYYAVTATISTLFNTAYPFLTETKIGLCFLSIGGGMFAGSLSSGKILDSEFQRINKGLSSAKEGADAKESSGGEKYGDHFPIEKVYILSYLQVKRLAALTHLYTGPPQITSMCHGRIRWLCCRVWVVYSEANTYCRAFDTSVFRSVFWTILSTDSNH